MALAQQLALTIIAQVLETMRLAQKMKGICVEDALIRYAKRISCASSVHACMPIKHRYMEYAILVNATTRFSESLIAKGRNVKRIRIAKVIIATSVSALIV